jgi:hypothetical protein
VQFINIINYLVNIENIDKISDLIKDEKYKIGVEFLNDIGYEFISSHLVGNKPINIHNIIKLHGYS